ncbi:MAG TPA: methyltransferase domain-containing protein [Polyangiaceae bacterium]|nr:methyltransferase domain-containing protein [Polyangiaceae bacterium]
MTRTTSFGEGYRTTWVDHFGVWLSGRQIRRFVPTFSGKVVADLGCGHHAAFSRTIVGEVERLVLVDVSLAPDLKAMPKVQAIEGGLPGSLGELANQSVDVVMIVSVLEHLWEPERTLSEIRRVLRPRGTCLVNVPSWLGKRYLELSAFKLGLSPADEMDDHKTYYDVKDLWPLLVRAGFKPSEITCFSHKGGLNTFAACRLKG